MTPNSSGTFQIQNIPWQAKLQGSRLATFKSRLLAFLLDLSFVGALLISPTIWKSTGDRHAAGTTELSIELGGLIAFATFVAYFAIATYVGRGSTVGKRIVGIRVVSLVHDHMSLWHCIERALGYSASSLEAGFGFVQCITHPNRQTVHDRIAETIVIDRDPRPKRAT